LSDKTLALCCGASCWDVCALFRIVAWRVDEFAKTREIGRTKPLGPGLLEVEYALGNLHKFHAYHKRQRRREKRRRRRRRRRGKRVLASDVALLAEV